jgi:hypothetical protein
VSLGRHLVLLASLVASVSYIGAVTQGALVTMVLPLVFVVGVVALRLRSRRLPALLAVVLSAGVGGELVNLLSGQFQGSVARSAAVAALAAGVAVFLSSSRRPALFLLPLAVIVAWALALGAGGRVGLVAVVTAGIAVVALAAVERDHRLYVVTPRVAGSVGLALLLVAAAGVMGAEYQLHHDGRRAASPFRQSLATTIEPPKILSLTRHPPPSATQAVPSPPTPRVTVPNDHQRLHQILREMLWGLLTLLLLLATVLVLRLLWVSLAWHRLRVRLQRREQPTEAGAWAWTLASLDRLGSPVAPHVSPDVASSEATAMPELVRVLARSVVPAVFAPASVMVAAPEAWSHARAAVDHAWHSCGRVRRLRARLRTPHSASHAQ